MFNPDNPLGRHSGEGRNPVIKNAPRSGQNHDVVPLPWEIVDQLDSGLRRNDTILANGQSGFKPSLIPECDYTVVANSWIVQINSQTPH